MTNRFVDFSKKKKSADHICVESVLNGSKFRNRFQQYDYKQKNIEKVSNKIDVFQIEFNCYFILIVSYKIQNNKFTLCSRKRQNLHPYRKLYAHSFLL